ncbi:MAG: hypothetical protein RL299_179 [Pseudomonadota bacterium]
MLKKIVVPSFALAAIALPIAAKAAEEDANIWLAQTTQVGLGSDVVLWLEAQERFTNDASRLGQPLVRPAAGYKLDKTTTPTLATPTS